MKNKIGIIAASTIDQIYDWNGKLIREQKGGPLYFYSKFFNLHKIPFSIIATTHLSVKHLINMDNNVEVHSEAKVNIDFKNIATENLLVSPIVFEFNLKNIYQYKGKIFIDAQGFIRVPGNSKKQKWIPTRKFAESIYCLKVSNYELPYIEPDFIEQQKQKILIVTAGNLGSILYVNKKSYNYKASKIKNLKDTIGAGDTYLAAFVSHFIANKNPLLAAKFASLETASFLSEKNNL